ncbi:hypothetical protein J1782_25030 [Rahnella sp. BCC 1045]|uniref:hypothetical protein n=1 Tax=Rahnella sp. BCC 1045 TaxID=2816251 RepID=UPI001C27BA26|nr:hypothetical protein [Rahnella sp. BCC 1045]MBU9823159.1 hypothetical protein [Rahnella sp. BCC 1045]
MKELKESVIAIIVLFTMLAVGYKVGYFYGMDDGVSLAKGEKWDCAWSDSTGFALCNRKPQEKLSHE